MSPSTRARAALVGVGAFVALTAFFEGASAQGTGVACTTAGACGAGEFCKFADYKCGGAGECWNPPFLCTADYDPVCGCNGETYSNMCQAYARSQSVRSKGMCGGGGGGKSSLRHLEEDDDMDEEDEVLPGASSSSPSDTSPQFKCGGVARSVCPGEDLYCKFQVGSCGTGDEMGDCHPLPMMCTMIYRPVCGCDGREYASDCEAAVHGVSVRHYGPCDSQRAEGVKDKAKSE